ncbi:MotA/TolQ/ExbB proton channel domain-containing protein [Desulfonema limicola]|uniref:MotA/TolQ/ExbB proton channel domain-containing protein n=1 Tax=Desulfonema limicola TaxID=45656 RepID=A0A975BEB8_9BACT|nr:MotA/TolQ/ExbB proton channel family protein [Desulfonema limicola]QTA83753.1 MotA/TolQ/ExbB proton channel domain-containing protein [Desulfonema limicola]
MSIFFHEQLSDTLDYLYQGGEIIFPLIFVSVWMWYLIVKKLYILNYWKKQRGKNADEIQSVITDYNADKTYDEKINRRLLQTIVKKRQQNIERHVQTIFVLASIAPLLGLLGTVTGMISTFEAISRFGTANTRAMAAGISEALITTQIGLIVAVPGLFMGHVIRRKTDAMQNRMDSFFLNMEHRIFFKTKINQEKT